MDEPAAGLSPETCCGLRALSRVGPALKQNIEKLPAGPGVYFFKDRQGCVLYIGKALSIIKRVKGHFRAYGSSGSKEAALLRQTASVEAVETATEEEALLLEASLVKEQLPRYNLALRDDKSFPYLKLTDEAYPRLLIVRRRKADGGKYFGPYTGAHLLNQAVKWLRREFPLRTCRTFPKKVCLWHHLGQCPGPCEKLVSREVYLKTVGELESFLLGKRDVLVRSLSRRMKQHAADREYEKAQSLFQAIVALRSVPSPTPKVLGGTAPLEELKAALKLAKLPSRIEGFDISNLGGAEAVGSMVVFEAGRPLREHYRRFRVRTVSHIDDYQMMREIVRRRYSGSLSRELPLPDLVVIDGGRGHLAAAAIELTKTGYGDLPVVSIAKEHEHIFLPGRTGPIVLSPASKALHVIRHLRDEAHRFAIRYHRRLHRKKALTSLLDDIPGVGPKTKEKLLRRIGSVSKMGRMKAQELSKEAPVALPLAERILKRLHEQGELSRRTSIDN